MCKYKSHKRLKKELYIRKGPASWRKFNVLCILRRICGIICAVIELILLACLLLSAAEGYFGVIIIAFICICCAVSDSHVSPICITMLLWITWIFIFPIDDAPYGIGIILRNCYIVLIIELLYVYIENRLSRIDPWSLHELDVSVKINKSYLIITNKLQCKFFKAKYSSRIGLTDISRLVYDTDLERLFIVGNFCQGRKRSKNIQYVEIYNYLDNMQDLLQMLKSNSNRVVQRRNSVRAWELVKDDEYYR